MRLATSTVRYATPRLRLRLRGTSARRERGGEKPKPLTLTREEWQKYRAKSVRVGKDVERVNATLDALFRYRERTRGMHRESFGPRLESDDVAREEGIE